MNIRNKRTWKEEQKVKEVKSLNDLQNIEIESLPINGAVLKVRFRSRMGTKRVRINVRGVETDFTLFFRKVSPFSNHHPADFYCDEAINQPKPLLFSCNEQFYMYNKASLFGDEKVMSEILKSDNPKQMKKMAGPDNIQKWNDRIWNQHKDKVMKEGSLAKFQQCTHLRYILFLSHGSQLIECSPFDRYWGNGKDIEAAQSFLKLGCGLGGENRLGKILDEIREMLWNDQNYRDERQYIEKRISEDSEFLEKAMKKIDLIYKDRAKQRHAIFRRYPHDVRHSELDTESAQLIPEWARPPPVVGEKWRICPSPAVYSEFEDASSAAGGSGSVAFGDFRASLAKRLSFRGVDLLPSRESRDREDDRRRRRSEVIVRRRRSSRSRDDNDDRRRRRRRSSSRRSSSSSRSSSRSRSTSKNVNVKSRERHGSRRKSESRSDERKTRKRATESPEEDGSRNEKKRRRSDEKDDRGDRRSRSRHDSRERGESGEKLNRKARRELERKKEEENKKLSKDRETLSSEKDVDPVVPKSECHCLHETAPTTSSQLSSKPSDEPEDEPNLGEPAEVLPKSPVREKTPTSSSGRKKKEKPEIALYVPGQSTKLDITMLREKYKRNKERLRKNL